MEMRHPPAKCLIRTNRSTTDSPLEGSGFEPSGSAPLPIRAPPARPVALRARSRCHDRLPSSWRLAEGREGHCRPRRSSRRWIFGDHRTIRALRAALTAPRAVRRSTAAGLSAADFARTVRSSWASFASAAALRRSAKLVLLDPFISILYAQGKRLLTQQVDGMARVWAPVGSCSGSLAECGYAVRVDSGRFGRCSLVLFPGRRSRCRIAQDSCPRHRGPNQWPQLAGLPVHGSISRCRIASGVFRRLF